MRQGGILQYGTIFHVSNTPSARIMVPQRCLESIAGIALRFIRSLRAIALSEQHMRYLIALVFCFLLASPQTHACDGPFGHKALFFWAVPDPQPDADVIAKVSLSDVKGGTATAKVMQVFKTSNTRIRQGSKITFEFMETSCGPWPRNGAEGTIIAKRGPDGVLRAYTHQLHNGHISLIFKDGNAYKSIDYFKTKCVFPNTSFPQDMLIYVAGNYQGRLLDFQIDQSGSMAVQFDITVNSPSRPVALMLGRGGPTIWNIQWTPGSKIAAVVVSGGGRQAIAGLDPAVPVLNSSGHNNGGCGRFVVSKSSCRESAAQPRGYGGLPEGVTLQSCEDNFEKRQKSRFNALSQQFFGRPVDFVVLGNEKDSIVIGEPLNSGTRLLTSRATPPSSFYDKNAPLAGQAGLDEAVAKGLLRPATKEDKDAWIAAVAANPDKKIPNGFEPLLHDAYVVLKEFTFPPGLSVPTFFIPKGVPLPKGHPGGSMVYDFNSLRFWCFTGGCPNWGQSEVR